jgi:hypothetical protein
MTPAAAGALAKKNAKAAAIKATALGLHSLDQHTIEQLQAYARERHILVQLYAKNKPPAKADYVCAILFSHLNALALGALKVQAQESGIDVSAYGTLKKDYVRALIDHRMGQPGEALGRDLMVTDQKAATSEASSTSSGGRDDGGDQQLWRDIYLVGTEWAVYDSVLEAGWDFGHLAAALAEGGDLYQAGAQHPVYLFGVTERTLSRLRPTAGAALPSLRPRVWPLTLSSVRRWRSQRTLSRLQTVSAWCRCRRSWQSFRACRRPPCWASSRFK